MGIRTAGMSGISICKGRVLRRYRCNARPDGIAGSLEVILAEVAAAVEVSINVIAPAAVGFLLCKVDVAAVVFNLVRIAVGLLRVVACARDLIIRPQSQRSILFVLDVVGCIAVKLEVIEVVLIGACRLFATVYIDTGAGLMQFLNNGTVAVAFIEVHAVINTR